MSPSKPTTIPSKKLRAFLDASKRETRLMGPLERHILQRPLEDRRQDVLHPSDLVKPEWCALHAYHALKGNYVPTSDRPTLRLQSIFDEGHSIHSKWQSWIGEMGVLYGRWACNACGYSSNRMTTEPVCVQGHKRGFTYKEVTLVSDKHRIAGHSDGWVKGLGDDFLIEIKSIGAGTIRMEMPSLLAGANGDLEAAWRAIRQPFRSHMLQGQMYLHLVRLMAEAGKLDTDVVPDEIVFIYELKANQDYKEFVVAYDFEYVRDIFENAADVAWAADNDRPPTCNIDPVKGCKRCESFRSSDE